MIGFKALYYKRLAFNLNKLTVNENVLGERNKIWIGLGLINTCN